MSDIIQRLRIKHTVYTTLLAGIILAVLLGGLFGLLYASANMVAERSIEAAMNSDTKFRPDDMSSSRCFSFTLIDGTAYYNKTYESDIDYYGDDITEIVREAISTGKGRFSVGASRFAVGSKSVAEGEVYAVYDRTTDYNTLLSAAMIIVVLYVVSMVLIALIAYLFSAKTTEPVKEAMERQRDLVTNASHELKTPLTIIATNLSVLKSEPSSTVEENGKWISSIDGQIERMDGLIKNMLELSKLEQSSVPKEYIDLSEIVECACLEFEAVCFEKQVTLISNVAKSVHVMGEAASLERLVIILLDNAVKYCGEGGKVGCKLSVDKKIKLTVMNTGEAISQEDAKHVFDRFYRSDGARSNPDGNSFGLGLSIAQATVLAHGGSIVCKGVENKGSVFEVILPLPKKKEIAKSAKALPACKKNDDTEKLENSSQEKVVGSTDVAYLPEAGAGNDCNAEARADYLDDDSDDRDKKADGDKDSDGNDTVID